MKMHILFLWKHLEVFYNQCFWHYLCGAVPNTYKILQFSGRQLRVQQFSSDISSMELVQTPQVKGSAPQDCLHFRRPVTSPRLSPILLTNWLHTSSSYKALLSFRNLLGFVCEVWKGPECGASVLVEFEVSTLPAHGGLHQPEALGTSPFTGGVPNSRIYCLMTSGAATVTVIEMKCAINVTCLNHSEAISPSSPWKHCHPVPGAKKLEDHWSQGFCRFH